MLTKKQKITVRFDKDDREFLNDLAEKKGTSVSSVLREIVRESRSQSKIIRIASRIFMDTLILKEGLKQFIISEHGEENLDKMMTRIKPVVEKEYKKLQREMSKDPSGLR